MTLAAALFCCSCLAQADPAAGGPRLTIATVDMRSAEWTGVSISAEGVLSGRVDGEERRVPLDDVLRIAPAVDPAAPHRPASRDGFVTLLLADGGRLSGSLTDAGAAAPRRLLVSLSPAIVLNVPLSAVAAIRTSPEQPEAEADLRQRIAERKPGRDLLLLVREGRTMAVPGSLERLTPREWEFAFESKSRTGPLSQAYAFVLGAPAAATARMPATISLHGGHRFGAAIRSAGPDGVRVDAGPLGMLQIAWSEIRSIDLLSERLVHLSDLKPVAVDTRSLTEAPWPPRMDASVAGAPLRIAGTTYARGVGVHAHCRLTYRLEGEFERFHAQVGVDDAVAPAGSVVFRVIGDGKTLFESPVLRGGSGPAAIALDVTGVTALVLECDPADELDLADHGDWVDAVLVRARREGSS